SKRQAESSCVDLRYHHAPLCGSLERLYFKTPIPILLPSENSAHFDLPRKHFLQSFAFTSPASPAHNSFFAGKLSVQNLINKVIQFLTRYISHALFLARLHP